MCFSRQGAVECLGVNGLANGLGVEYAPVNEDDDEEEGGEGNGRNPIQPKPFIICIKHIPKSTSFHRPSHLKCTVIKKRD